MSNALVLSNELDVMTLGNVLASSGYFQDARDQAQAVVKVLAGRELGVPPIASMTGIHIINGKPTLSANLMASVIKSSGKYDYRVVRLDKEGCELIFYEQGEEVGRSLFTMEDADAAGALTGRNKHTWQAYGRNMLFARAMSNGARWYCPEIFAGGIVYTPEEMGANINADGQVIDVAPTFVDTRTGEVLDQPPEPAKQEMTADEAKKRFYDAFGKRLGGKQWLRVQRLLAYAGTEPQTPEEWIDIGREVKAKFAELDERQAAQKAEVNRVVETPPDAATLRKRIKQLWSDERDLIQQHPEDEQTSLLEAQNHELDSDLRKLSEADLLTLEDAIRARIGQLELGLALDAENTTT